MIDNNPRQDNVNQRNLENLVLDRELDAALAKFAAVEPRAGLEERVLANLRIEQRHAAGRSWWRWPAVGTLAALIVVTVFMIWRSSRPAHNIVEQHQSATTRTDGQNGTQVVNNGGASIRLHQASGRPSPHTASHAVAVVASAPKLDQFPSPQPLSEQERILTRYVTNYPAHAALIAQARADELRRDLAEEMGEVASGSGQNSQQRNK
jgi:hypothetical protein